MKFWLFCAALLIAVGGLIFVLFPDSIPGQLIAWALGVGGALAVGGGAASGVEEARRRRLAREAELEAEHDKLRQQREVLARELDERQREAVGAAERAAGLARETEQARKDYQDATELLDLPSTRDRRHASRDELLGRLRELQSRKSK